MKVYLINKETVSMTQEFDNVTAWSYNFVEYINNGYRAKFYCNEEQYFTDNKLKLEVAHE